MQLKTWQGVLIVAIVVFFPIFGNLGALPIVLWDESRLAMNALEMMHADNPLIPTYKGVPDFWSAKPPMMIWLQALSLHLFGFKEWAIRLPAAMAAFLNCLFLYWVFGYKYKQPLLGIFVATVLGTCAGLVRIHGSRTGDYDALLVLFGSMFAFFYFIWTEEQKTRYLYYGVLALVAATLTKGIASLILLPAMLLYTIMKGHLPALLRTRHTYICIGIYCLLGIGYYLLRERFNPGYIRNVYDNEIGGRFMYGEGHNRYDNPFYYYDFFFAKTFRDWYKILFAGWLAALLCKDKFLKRTVLYSTLLGLFYFVVVSKSRAKAEWYDMMSYPFFAVITGVGIYLIIDFLYQKIPVKFGVNKLVPALFILAIYAQPLANAVAATKGEDAFKHRTAEQYEITHFLQKELRGMCDTSGLSITYDGYHADVDWYLRVLERQGRKIPFVQIDNLQPGQKVIAFQEPERTRIENFYNFTVSDTYGNTLRVYTINGKK